MLLTDIEERHKLALDLLQFFSILLIGIFKMLERSARINIVARIDANLLTIQCSHISRMSRKMNIGHQRRIVAVGLQLGRDILHVLRLTGTLGSETHQFATCIDDALGLCHTALGIIRIHSTHRLDADGVRASNADTTDTSLCGESSLIHLNYT